MADDRKSEVSQAGDQTKLSAAASIGVDEGAPPIRIIDVDRAPVGVVVQGLSLVGVLRIDEADRQPSGPRVEHAEAAVHDAEAMVDAMVRLDKAMRQRVAQLSY